jgi:hypothetical protein
MRNYLYIWHDPNRQFVVTSGPQFKDLAPYSSAAGGLLLLAHSYAEATHDQRSGFDYVPVSQIERARQDDVYSWGDICWVDYAGPSFPTLTKSEVAELLYFKHTGEPFQNIGFQSLRNRFLAVGHDDGWFLKLYYESWSDMAALLGQLKFFRSLDSRATLLRSGAGAFWIDRAGIAEEEATFDIDSLLNRKQQKDTEPSASPNRRPAHRRKTRPPQDGGGQ